jgi:hypothetical protein
MKIKVIKGTVTHESKEYGVGKELEVDNKNAERLISLGYAEKADGSKTGTAGASTPSGGDTGGGGSGKK